MNTLRKPRSWNVESLEARMLLAGDLVAHWNANDLIDSVQHGEAVSSWTDRINQIEAKAGGNPLLQEDAIGGRPVVQFDASDQKDWFEVEAANNPLTSANDFSVAITFATTTTDLTGARNIWHQGTGLVHSNRFGFAKDWGITLNSDGNASTGISGGFGQSVTSVFGNTALNDGSAHVVMMTRSAGTVTLYVNGDRIASESDGDPAPRDVMEFFIGVNDDHIGQLNASIGDVRVYDGALTDGEANSEFEIIQSFYNNQVPTAIDDQYTVNEDALLFVVPGDGVLANDLDDDGDPLSAVLVSEPLNGAVTFNENGSFLYDPDRDFNGIDSFTYSAVDFRSSEPATVVIDVTPTRDAPFGLTDQYKLTPERPLTLPGLVGVLSNDLNADDLPIRAELATPPQFGQLTLRDDGGFTFDPAGQSGTATFSYRIVDDQSTSGEINVNLIVNSVPVANNDLFEIDEDTLLTLAADDGVLANDVDADGNSLTISILSDVQNGALTIGENGSIAYEPNEHFFGIDTFGYIITDGIDSSQIATATIRVRATNDHPDAVDDAYFARVDSELVISADRGVLRNDSDVEDEALQASLVTQPANGTISISEQGAFTYQPNNGFTGEDTFQYAAIDAGGARSEATVKLFVGNAPIRINEFMAVNASTLETRVREEPDDRFRGDSTTPDWVELVNRSQSSIDISGFHLTDSPTNTMAWSFPDGTVIPAGGYLLVFLDRIDVSDTVLDESGIFHATFKLNALRRLPGIDQSRRDGSRRD